MNKTTKAHLGLIGTNLFFAINYNAIKYFTGNGYAGPFGLNIIRIGVSVILFWSFFLFAPVKKNSQKRYTRIFVMRVYRPCHEPDVIYKRTGLYFFHTCLTSYIITPILITLIASVMLKERLTPAKVIGLLLAATGAVILITTKEITAKGENVFLGDMLVICSAVAYTFYFITVKPLMQKYDSIDVMRWVFTFGFFMIVPVCVREFSQITWPVFTFKEYFLLFMISVPGTFLAYIFNAYGIKILNASTAGAYIYSQPVFAVAIAMIFLKEELLPHKILAAALIFAGVYLSNRKTSDKS